MYTVQDITEKIENECFQSFLEQVTVIILKNGKELHGFFVKFSQEDFLQLKTKLQYRFVPILNAPAYIRQVQEMGLHNEAYSIIINADEVETFKLVSPGRNVI